MHRLASLLFAVGCVAQIQFTYPVSYQTNVPMTNCTVSWTPTNGTYTLRLGTTPGAYNIIYRTGLTNNSYTINLPSSSSIYGHVFASTSIGGDVVFSTTQDVPDTSLHYPGYTNDVDNALWATAAVHNMRNIEGYAYPWSLLEQDRKQNPPKCSDFANTLRDLLGTNYMNVGFSGHPTYILQLAFETGTTYTHTIVTAWNDQQQTWMLLDPLFAFDLTRTHDGAHATKEDMNAATLSKAWNLIAYNALTPDATNFAKAYSTLDYPLAWLQIPAVNYTNGTYAFSTITNSASPYLNTNGLPLRFVFIP